MVELHITVRFPVSQLSSLIPQLNKAASRLTVNPFGSQARHFPYIAGGAATQRKTLLRFWLLIMMHSSLHRAIAYIALTLRHRGRHSLVAVCG